jgi:hypothetical protein
LRTLIGPAGATAIRVQPAEGGRLLFATPAQELMPDASYTLLVAGAAARNGHPLPLTAIDFHTRSLPAPDAVRATPSATPVSAAPVRSGSVATADKADGCASRPSAPMLCHDLDSLVDGIWTPGRNNTLGRWC